MLLDVETNPPIEELSTVKNSLTPSTFDKRTLNKPSRTTSKQAKSEDNLHVILN